MKVKLFIMALFVASLSFLPQTTNAGVFVEEEVQTEVLTLENDLQHENVEVVDIKECSVDINLTVTSPDGTSTTITGTVTASSCKEAIKAAKIIAASFK